IRSAYGIAVEASSVRTYLNMLLQAAFRTAKRVRTETNIGEYSVSVSSAAVDLARKIFGTLDRCPVLVVGAGEMAELAVRHLVAGGAKTVRVANRSPEAGQRLATEFSGQAVPLSDLAHWVAMSDIVLTSTGSPEILVGRFMAQSIVRRRKNKPIVFIDISVPRNVDPRLSELDNVFCYDIDDLGAVAEANRAERKQEAAEAERIIGQEVEAFCSRAQAQDIGPTIAELQDRIEGICRGELQRYLRKSAPRNEKETRELEWMVLRIAGKIAHPLITQLKASHHDPDKQDACLETIRRMFVGDTPSENGKSA
ncbi:MAG: glutamyl-tRNA reductase, partial [Acidobacteriota bacterium]